METFKPLKMPFIKLLNTKKTVQEYKYSYTALLKSKNLREYVSFRMHKRIKSIKFIRKYTQYRFFHNTKI